MPDNQDNPVPSIRVHSDDLDENGFAKLWSIASASSEGNLEATRRLAAVCPRTGTQVHLDDG